MRKLCRRMIELSTIWWPGQQGLAADNMGVPLMQRRTLDALLAAGGLIVAAILLVVGGLATWAGNFVADNVTTQLSAQQIFFPKAGSAGLKDPKIGPYLNQYAGQQLTTGDQAKAYADHFIAVHVAAATGNRSYAQVSAATTAVPRMSRSSH